MPVVEQEDGTLRYKVREYWIPKPWQGLTDKEIADFSNWLSYMNLVKAIEAKLKDKNHG